MKRVIFGVSGHFPENAWRKWPEILQADVSWPPSEVVSLWPWSVDFFNFGAILTYWNRSNLGFPGISRRMHGGNGLKFCTLMYLDNLQKWLVLGHSLLNFVILALFGLSETGQIWSVGHFLENAWKEWPEIWYASVSWPTSKLVRLCLRSVDFSNFGAILT